MISAGFKSEYNVGGVPDPFLQVEMLKLLCMLARNDAKSSEMLVEVLAQVWNVSLYSSGIILR